MVNITRQTEGNGLQDVEEQEILDPVMPGSEALTAADAEEMLQLAVDAVTQPQNESDDMEQNFHLKSLIKIIDLLQSAIDEAMASDPGMTRCVQFKHTCNSAIAI